MSGHSKWATIKHKKGAADAKRGKLFNKLARQIEVAARGGGGDPDMNPTLRTAVQKAKAAQMTNDAIDRAIKRGTGDHGGAAFESIMYEGYAPGGVALLIDTLTDNRNRTGADVRSTLSKLGGSLGEPGTVAWQFKRQGQILLESVTDGDELMLAALDAGADDVSELGDGNWQVIAAPGDTYEVKEKLEAAGYKVAGADTPLISENVIPITSVDDAKKILRLIETLEDNDDVQDVFANYDIADDIMEAAAE